MDTELQGNVSAGNPILAKVAYFGDIFFVEAVSSPAGSTPTDHILRVVFHGTEQQMARFAARSIVANVASDPGAIVDI